ncbi:aminoglycoside adenylyltransferase domain-containing protein [Halobacillus salinus]|uniref:aminoglycoside adenylyltransferase domain-containing protein n=1 Tax=Halobacillus salinus TaxID=192814 RepID=UPI0009A6F9F5|nr:aminoglycoside adenylyltransferase domain-containing protein [Halobacillus salinus]
MDPCLPVPSMIRSVVQRIEDAIRRLLSDQFVGLYIHGSAVTAGFVPDRSDIDVLVVTIDSLNDNQRKELTNFFLGLSDSPYPIEISIITKDSLRSWSHPSTYEFHFSEAWRGELLLTRTSFCPVGVDGDLAAHVTMVRQRGVRVSGPEIKEVFPSIPEADFLSSVVDDTLQSLKAIGDNPNNAVLNAVRLYSYLKEGKYLSKEEGGRWAAEQFGEPFRSTVHQIWLRSFKRRMYILSEDEILALKAELLRLLEGELGYPLGRG